MDTANDGLFRVKDEGTLSDFNSLPFEATGSLLQPWRANASTRVNSKVCGKCFVIMPQK
jgi:hypothetical protein